MADELKIEPAKTWFSGAFVYALCTTLVGFMFTTVWWAAAQTIKMDTVLEALKDQPEIRKDISEIKTDIAVIKAQQSSSTAGLEKKRGDSGLASTPVPLTPVEPSPAPTPPPPVALAPPPMTPVSPPAPATPPPSEEDHLIPTLPPLLMPDLFSELPVKL
jgi:hypothetical protein